VGKIGHKPLLRDDCTLADILREYEMIKKREWAKITHDKKRHKQ